MQALPMAAIGLSTGLQVFGAIEEGKQIAAQEKVNAEIARRNAETARTVGQVDAQDASIDARNDIGSLIANVGSSGLKIGQGSAALRRKSLQELSRRDSANIIYNSELEATSFDIERIAAKQRGKAAKSASYIKAATSLIGGATQMFSPGAGGVSPFARGTSAFRGPPPITVTGSGSSSFSRRN